MKKSLETIVNKNKYTSKVNNDKVKILPKNTEVYKNCQIFENIKFYMYKISNSKEHIRVVLHNIYHSVSLELKEELTIDEEINIFNIKHNETYRPLLLFFIDLKQKHNNKEMY